ncbi:MAG: amidophosphoribosyltransferase [Deltaproteobacteria bacterium]|nr:amidophosphoribosyltransferase [Deltaproteobacteria bacterium]MCB9788852.1 amidophosphoribosyltransferase [Deltaproteobacteria bacterium]
MCGVFGVWNHGEASNITYLGLHGLQHRGQESAGIVSSHDSQLVSYRRMGRVAEVFDSKAIAALPGTSAIGHVRYSTAGMSIQKNAQPFAVEFKGASLAIAHNGNLTNAVTLRRRLEDEGALFHTTMDTEIFVHLLARSKRETLVERMREAMDIVEGAYSLLILTPDQLLAVRDPHGFRPLVLGELGDGHVLSSESCSLRLVDATPVREIEPGEMLIFDAQGMRSIRRSAPAPRYACIFEHIYFARPDSQIFGEDVYGVRKESGRRLAVEAPAPGAEVVIPVPDSGNAAALGFAQEAGLPFEQGLIRSHYAGRTFIEPAQSIRHFGVKLKLSPVESVIRDRSVVVIDDSLVRGTTSRKIVRMLRDAGAREVHMRIACPPTTHSCFYGIDTPDRAELIAANKSTAEIAEFLGADSLSYLSLDGLHASVKGHGGGYCSACFTGRYPIRVPEESAPAARLSEHE